MKKIVTILMLVILLGFIGNVSAFDPLFDARIDYGVGNFPKSVFAADFDGDGDSDLAVANSRTDSVSILINYGNGTYQAAVNYETENDPYSVFDGL